MSKYFFIFWFYLLITPLLADQPKFATDQLPLSRELQKSFPNIKAVSFMIANKEAEIVLHEKNSKEKINGGTFNDLVFLASKKYYQEPTGEIELMQIYSKKCKANDTQYSKLSKTDHKTTLYDICCIFDEISHDLGQYSKIIKDVSNTKYFSFHSALYSFGCVFKYKNKFNCEFISTLYGYNSEKELLEDIEKITTWLDQFFLYKVSEKNEVFARIPLFFAEINYIELKLKNDHFVLISKRSNKNILKTKKYKTMMGAPIVINTNVGFIFYKTSTFENSTIKPVNIEKKIEKGSRFKVICDSICYIIFGSPFGAGKKEESNRS